MAQETNQQKAKEISQLWWRECGWQLQSAAYDAAIEAMAWKDEQAAKEKQQWIEKACECLKKQAVGFWIDHLVYELKQAMKGK